LRLKARKPETLAVQGDTLGAKLRRRRRELALRRIDVASTLGISWKSLMWWERDLRLPFVHAYPRIIEFLGYEPWDPPQTLAEALLAERRRQGLSVEGAADIVSVDPGTWLRWERGEWKPTRRSRPGLDTFLGMDTKRTLPADVR
jgi:transcriptional regulator with XRE-family HTH domain